MQRMGQQTDQPAGSLSRQPMGQGTGALAAWSGRAWLLRLVGCIVAALLMAGCRTPDAISTVPATARASTSLHATFDTYSIGELDAPRPGPTRAALLLLGGGDWPVEAFRWFMDAAGNGHIVILRAAGNEDLQAEIWRDIGGATSLQTIVFRDRRAADSPAVAAILAKADGIFLGGGDQSKYVNFWKGTAVQRAIDAHVRAGKPLGGTSAGLAVLGAYGYGAMDGDSMDSPRALADPLRSGLTLVGDFLHVPGLELVFTDSHFAQRQRQGRLVAFLARLAHDEGAAAAQVIGLGVDEEGAVCLEPNGEGRIYSRNGGYAWLVEPTQPAAPLQAGVPLRQSGVRMTGAGTASRLWRRVQADGSTRWEVESPAFVREYDAADGVLRERAPSRPRTR